MRIDFDKMLEWYIHHSAVLVWVWMAAAVVFSVITVNVGGIVLQCITGVLWVATTGTFTAWFSATDP